MQPLGRLRRFFVGRRQKMKISQITVIVILIVTFLWFYAKIVNEEITKSANPKGGQVCVHPNLPLNNSEIMKHIKPFPKIVCGTREEWVINNGTHAYVSDMAKTEFGIDTCTFIPLEWKDDRTTVESVEIIYASIYEFKDSDFVKVSCTSPTQINWNSLLAAPRKNVALPTPNPGSGIHPRLNVLIWGHDSISRNMFIRKLNKTYKFLKNDLKTLVLEGYNIVGDGTPPALIPILTGYTEVELPEVRRSKLPDAKYLDQAYPFIWNDYKYKGGYLTAYLEDCPNIGTFQYRLMGFESPPTDFYMRQFFVAVEEYIKINPKYCLGSIPRHKVIMNYFRSILNYKKDIPKFLFSFHSELSHNDINLIKGADEDLADFFRDLDTSGILNNTVLIVMSDHGPRFAKHRENQQGKLEERMPFFSFRFPEWFERVYRTAYINFVKNTQRLTTPFDIHETLLEILKMDGRKYDNVKFQTPNHAKTRQMSLFQEVPISRSCAEADIEPHWCACLNWSPVSRSSYIATTVAKEVVAQINKITSEYRNICAELVISEVIDSSKYSPSEQLLKFKKSADRDGRVADLSDTVSAVDVVYQVTVETKPGNGHFEASVNYDAKRDKYTVEHTSISRINKYGRQAAFVDMNQISVDIRKFCYCLTV